LWCPTCYHFWYLFHSVCQLNVIMR
jgi:hypothetical protein